jgi:hypothetical protein
LRQVVEDGPIPARYGVVRWRLIDLAQWLFEEFLVSISKPTLSRELRHMGFASSRRDRAIMRKTRKPRRLLKRMARPVCKRFYNLVLSVCDNVSGLRTIGLAKMEIRASWSS